MCNEQCVSHMRGKAPSSIDKRMHVNNMQGNQFVHMNRFSPLYESDFDIVNDCQSSRVILL